MAIGIIGLGKLGLPVAVAIDYRGFDVIGYDIDPSRMSKEPQKYKEFGPNGDEDFNDYLSSSRLKFASGIDEVVEECDCIFIAIQTPHEKYLDGSYSFNSSHLADFNYEYLQSSIMSLSDSIYLQKKDTTIAIISTVLPGTYHSKLTIYNKYMHVAYNPFFIAMSTVMRDFLFPEFVLLGVESNYAANMLDDFYREVTLNDAPRVQMSIPSAEAAKVLYNTYISAKIGVVNTAQMICDNINGCDINEVLSALRLGTKRLLSDQYMYPGMGDGGGCHPRDNLALGWLMKEKIGKRDAFNPFYRMMKCREDYALYLAERILRLGVKYDLSIGIYGITFKKNVAITDGSHALLVYDLLSKRFGIHAKLFDPVIGFKIDKEPRVYLIGSNHDCVREERWPDGSVVVDPWHIVPFDAPGAKVVRIG